MLRSNVGWASGLSEHAAYATTLSVSQTNADKPRILEAADRCTQPGEIGALIRREGIYSSSLSAWRRQSEAADLAALAPHARARG